MDQLFNYEIKSEKFSGPLDKLLELIEEKRLEITEISLAEVTADFLNYIKSLEQKIDSGILADFLVVAARLLLIKSKALLPSLELTKEEETEIKDLEGRLKLYREFKRASEYINGFWIKNERSFSRPFLMNLASVFYPPKTLKTDDLIASAKNLLASLKALLPEATAAVKEIIITIESKIKELLGRFQETAEQNFKKIAGGGSKKEIIVSFLAILHLFKDQIIQIEQNEQFGDITLKKV